MSQEPSDKPPRGPNGPPQIPNRFGRSLTMWVLMGMLGAILLLTFGKQFTDGGRKEISASDFWQYAKEGRLVGELVIYDTRIEGTLAKGTAGFSKDKPVKFVISYARGAEQDFESRLLKALEQGRQSPTADPGTATLEFRYVVPSMWDGVWMQLLLGVVMVVAIYYLLFRRIGSATGGGGFLGGFGRSRHRLATKEQSRVTFQDVAGIDEAKEEVQEIIEFLRSPRKFQRLGGRVPRGVLLVGEPGCGKTLLARAIAGEAAVPFFSISGSDFVEMFVGVGASRVRDLFKQAKESAPCIVFLDEIDAVGRKRGVGFNGGGHDEREQTLNAILVEMDGFDSSDQVIVMAATNRADVLDPALIRPGRFDRQVQVPLPDVKGRYEILKIYVNKVRCGPDMDLQRLARGTPMFSGADLAAMVNEAAIAATMANKEFIEQADLEEARDKVRWGRSRKSRAIDEHEKEMTAFHEAGHAVVQLLTPDADPLHKVSIIPRGPMGGATFALPEKDRYMFTRKWCEAAIRVSMAGRIAEELFCGDVDSGAASDISHATEIARRMVMDWGMSERLGFVRYAVHDGLLGPLELAGGKEYSDKTAEIIDEEVKHLMADSQQQTRQLIESRRQEVEAVARALLKYETLSGDEVRAIVDGKVLDKPTVGDLLDREHARSVERPAVQPSGPEDLASPGRAVPRPT